MRTTTKISAAEFALFSIISADRNPIHISPETARTTFFGQNIVFGVQTAMTALEAVLLQDGVFENRHIKAMSVRLMAPVYADDVITIDGELKQRDTYQIVVSMWCVDSLVNDII